MYMISGHVRARKWHCCLALVLAGGDEGHWYMQGAEWLNYTADRCWVCAALARIGCLRNERETANPCMSPYCLRMRQLYRRRGTDGGNAWTDGLRGQPVGPGHGRMATIFFHQATLLHLRYSSRVAPVLSALTNVTRAGAPTKSPQRTPIARPPRIFLHPS